MWGQRRSWVAHGWLRAIVGLLAILVGVSALASTAPPHAYYVLSPEPLTGPIAVMSLEPANTVSVGGYSVALQQYETVSIPAAALTSGAVISGTKFFAVASAANAADLLVPDDFAGTSFVVPQIAGSHRYYFMSPSGTSQVTIRVGASTYNITANPGIVNEFNSGTDNTQAVRITASTPIVLTHVADLGGTARDAHPVPPAAVEVFGIRSQNAILGALSDGTSVTVYASNGSSSSYSLNAGQQIVLAPGVGATQGQGNALHVVANAPIAAVQYDDGDGAETTGFWPKSSFGRRYGFPVSAQYVAIACDQPNVTITLYRGTNDPQTQVCSGSSTTPGKAYFGANMSGANINAGWYLVSSSPVYATYENALSEDESNNLGLVPVVGPAKPSVNSVASPTFSNPQTISGTAGANQTVRLYVNGLLQTTTTADGSGAYTFSAALADGNNVLYATAVTSGNESDPSNAISIQYTNNIPRSQSGTIGGNVVWTPGSPAQPYTITAADLTIAPGAKLVLQPGTQLQFGSGRKLVVNGALVIGGGVGAAPVKLTSNAATPARGDWTGIVLTSSGSGSTIANAVVEWATTGIDINGAAGVTITGTTIRNCATGIKIAGAVSPVINQGNTITANTNGIQVIGPGSSGTNPTPIVNRNNIYGNTTWNVTTGSFVNGPTTNLSFQQNWWGSMDPAAISAKISDFSNNVNATSYPVVDYSRFLDGLNGSVVAGNYLIGSLGSSTTLASGTTYEMLGRLIEIPAGQTLTVPAGVRLRFHGSTQVRVKGVLRVQGTQASPVTFTSGKAAPAKGDWTGIVLASSGSGSTIANAVVEWAATGINISGAAGVTITGTMVRNCATGIRITGAVSPVINQGNTITANTNGIQVTGPGSSGTNPTPMVNRNNIYGNTTWNVTTGSFANGPATNLNFQQNWWGSADPATIGVKINDYSSNVSGTSYPVVDYSRFLDGVNGNVVAGNYLIGTLGSGTTLASGTTYEILGSLIEVPAGQTLTVPAGVKLRFYGGTQVRVKGALRVQGTQASPVTFTSGKAAPAKGDWTGLVLTSSGSGSTIANATVEWATTGIDISGAAGVTITGTMVRNCATGIRIAGAVSPVINQGNTITANTNGIQVTGPGSSGANPTPTVNRNNIYGNTTWNVTTGNFVTGPMTTLSFQQNWWGTTDPATISAKINDYSNNVSSTSYPVVDYSRFLDAVNGSVVAGNYLIGSLGSSTTLTSGTTYEMLGRLIEIPAGQTLTVPAGVKLRFYGGTQVRVRGVLRVQGTQASPVTFTSVKAAPAKGDWTGIVLASGGSGSTIANAVVEWATTGIDINGAAAVTITGTTIRNCATGIRIAGAVSPVINQGNTITANTNGIQVTGPGSSGTNPTPTVNRNNIYGNTTWNVTTLNFANGPTTNLSFQQNWWGSTDPATIGAKINDYSSNMNATSYPVVDYSRFLDGVNGNVVAGNYLIGTLASSTTLASGTTYEMLGALIEVPAGQTLTVPAGVRLRFHGNTQVRVKGVLSVQGTQASPVTFTSGKAAPAKGDWTGIVLTSSGSGSSIANAVVEWATTGIDISGAAGVTITGTTVRNSTTGIRITGAVSPVINQGNTITANTNGIQVTGPGSSGTNPTPTVNRNSIYGNTTWNVTTGSFANGPATNLSFQQNWWGTTDPAAISAKINDYGNNTGSTSYPVVDYSRFLDAVNGNVVVGNYLIGPLQPTSTTLTAGATYDVLGTVTVGAGKTLVIPAGTALRFFGANTRLAVDGTLSIQGSQSAPVRLTSALADPVKGAWYGIDVRATATNVVISYAVIDWSVRGVSVTNTNATVGNSIIRNFSDAGIWMSGAGTASRITNNYIDNITLSGNGIYLAGSSPMIANNQIYRTNAGIYLFGASNPTITANVISNNSRGIVLDGNGSNSATAVPNPTITGNDIFGNGSAQIEVYRYGATNPVIVNATNNYFGTATPQAGQQIKFTSGSPSSSLNFSTPASAPLNGAAGGNLVVSEPYFSPNGDSIKDATTISGTLSQAASWTVRIRDPRYSEVKAFTGSGTGISAVWDGRNSSNQLQADGIYNIEVSVTDSAGTRIVGIRPATLDNTPPATAITNPASGAVLANALSVAVIGSASDTYLTGFTLQYGAGQTPTSWTNINSQSTGGINNALLGTWVVNRVDGTAGLAGGPYVLRLSTSDRAGNARLVQVPVRLDLISITAVSPSAQVIKPAAGEQFRVSFTLSAPATVSLRMFPEQGGALVREVTQNFTSAGAKTLAWDGRTSAGALVADEAYSYVLVASDGSRTATFDPVSPSGDGSGSGTVDLSFNANRNDFWKMSYVMNHWGRIRMQVSGCTSPTHYPYNWAPYPPGTHPLIWDGRGADGQLVSGACEIYFDAPQYMKTNSVIVRGSRPTVTGAGVSPNIEVRSDPYSVTHSYERVSRITYRLDQDAFVTIKLLPPGVSDPTSSAAIVLTNNERQSALSGAQPLDHTVEWRGYVAADTNNILISQEGSYTFAIQATSVTTGATTLYRGVLQLWQ